ncbi:MAG: YdbL family protein [Opitutales bacterium]|nr:YdbL family protein [Opitutales bacterium]
MNPLRIVLSLFVLCALLGATLSASPVDRMRERQPAVDEMKLAGVVGENNLGFLEAREDLEDAREALLRAENADRREVYAMIARRTNSSAEEVGQQRAIRIAQQAREGVWLQDARGRWYRKGDDR